MDSVLSGQAWGEGPGALEAEHKGARCKGQRAVRRPRPEPCLTWSLRHGCGKVKGGCGDSWGGGVPCSRVRRRGLGHWGSWSTPGCQEEAVGQPKSRSLEIREDSCSKDHVLAWSCKRASGPMWPPLQEVTCLGLPKHDKAQHST
jgi:hypothetical protein